MKPYCILPWTNLYLSPIGYGIECPVFFKENEHALSHTIEEVYNSDYLKQIRKNCIRQDVHEACAKCVNFKKDSSQITMLNKLIKKGGRVGENAQTVLDSYLESKYDINIYPIFISFEVSYKCNIKCIYCDLKTEPFNYDTTLINSVFKITDLLAELHLTGGEPFVNKEVIDFVLNKPNEPQALSFTTNGTKLKNYIPSLLAFKNLSIYISLDTINKKVLEYERLGVNYDHLMDSIQQLISCKQNKHDFSIGFSVCITKSNITQLNELIDWSVANNIDIIQFCYLNGDHEDLDIMKNPKLIPISEWSFLKKLKKSLHTKQIQFIDKEPLINFINSYEK